MTGTVALVVFVCVVSIPSLIWFVNEVGNAPAGYEDKDGYHNDNDTPDDGLAIVALAVAVIVLVILGGLAWMVFA